MKIKKGQKYFVCVITNIIYFLDELML